MKDVNVVIIMADQLRFDMLGEDTPNIIKLAKEGVNFKRAYTASPLCVPARGAFFTGLYPNLNGSIINPWFELDAHHGDINKGIPNLYKMLEEDFDSWHSGKQHLFTEEGKMEHDENSKTHWIATDYSYNKYMEENDIRKPGGDKYKGRVAELTMGKFTRVRNYSIPTTGCYEEGFDNFFDGYYVNHAIEAIRNRDKNKPLLLNAMFVAPHPPLEIPKPWYNMYKDVPMPTNVGVYSKDQSPLQMYNLPGIVGSRYTRDDWKKIWPVYKGLVSLLDHCVGLIVEELKKQGIYDDSLIIFTSDHGEMLGSHGLWQKMCMYEEAVRIPLFIKFPSSFEYGKKEVDEIVSGIDVLPTIFEYLEIDNPKELSGVSLMGTILGEKINREMIFIQFDGNGARGNFQRAVVKGNLKLIVDIFKDEIYFELYDVLNDPNELENLAFNMDFKNEVEYMFGELVEHMDRTNDMISLERNAYKEFLINYGQLRNKYEE